MGFRQSGQGPVDWLHVLCGLLLLLCATAFWGCAPKAATPGSATIIQASDQPTACPPAATQESVPAPAPQRAADFASVFEDDGSPLRDVSLDADYDDAEFESAGDESAGDESAEACREVLESVQEVPSVGDVVLAQYEDWRGVRYRPGGSDYRGVDCSGLVQAIFRDAFEVDLPRSSSDQAQLGESVAKGDIRPGDLLYFIDRGRKHVGVAVNDQEFVHASRRKGVMLSKFDGYWSKRLIRVRRILDDKNQDALMRKGG